jgi:hydroxymethylglutaryl-CoA reductase
MPIPDGAQTKVPGSYGSNRLPGDKVSHERMQDQSVAFSRLLASKNMLYQTSRVHNHNFSCMSSWKGVLLGNVSTLCRCSTSTCDRHCHRARGEASV